MGQVNDSAVAMAQERPWLEVGAGEIVVGAGGAAAVCIVQEGEIELCRSTPSGPVTVAVLGKGDCLVSPATAEGRVWATRAIARSDCRLLRIDWSVLATILRERPEIAARMIQQLAVQLERLYDGVVAADRPAMAPSAGGPATASPAAGGPNVDGVTAALVHEPTGRSFPLRPGGALVVGRPGADGVLHADIDLSELDPLSSISRRHARIEGRADGFYACEQAPTTNGTLVDGVRIGVGEEVKLVSGSKIQFGGVEMMFRQAESGC